MLIRTFLLIPVFLLAISFSVYSQTTSPVENGVSQTLARWRAAHYNNVKYKLNITLEKGAPLMKGGMEISVTLTAEGAQNDLVLDWRTTQFENDKDKPYAAVTDVNGAKDPPIVQLNEHLKVPRSFLKAGENIIKIDFASPIKVSGSAITRYVDREDGGEYIYSLFVPSDASTAFPCFDQPDLKARFSLTIQTRGRQTELWDAVSNTEPESGANTTWGIIRKFKETQPISTYVFAFAVGDFVKFNESELPQSAGSTARKNSPANAGGSDIYVRRSQAEKFKPHAAEVFRLNREGVKFLEGYFDYKFPFPKYDLVLIPEFPFGGMEHAGATFLRESSVIFPQEPTADDHISRANVIFHEAAHQWFGDTVTMRWFDDLWLKEGFAEFMAYKTLEKVMPQYNAWKVFYERNKQAAYLTDSTKGTTPIYQEIPNLSAAKSAYGNIVYRKAPSFLKQAEFYLEPDRFQIAVRAFLKKHQFANAGWADLVKEFETAGEQDLKDWADRWVKKPGASKFKFSWSDDMGAPYAFRMEKTSYLGGEPNSKQFIQVLTRSEGKDTVRKISIDERFGFFKPTPELIFFNYQDYGYGVFLLDNQSQEYVLQNIQNEKDDFLRSMMWGSLWDSVREAELDPRDYVELVLKNLGTEKDEVTISGLLGRVGTAMNYYLPEKQRDELAPRVENLLLEKMNTARSLGQKLTFYRSFLGMASTERARAVLKQVLKGEFSSTNLPPDNNAATDDTRPADTKLPDNRVVFPIVLKTKDKFDIVTRLLILGDKDAPALLAELEKSETSDEAKRYAYAAKAGIATAENKAKFWSDFVGSKEISESWIEAAFVSFNSVRHSHLTMPYLEKALAELPNLKRNRKIFFVNGWLGAFIGGQKSEQALAVVNKFLKDNPDLDKDLRLKILENADLLERSVKIRKTFSQ